VKKEIGSLIKGKPRASSFFVFMEYKRTFIYNLILFYFVLKSSDDLSDAIKTWNEEFRTRRLKDLNFVLPEIITQEGANNDKNIALVSLKTIIINAYDQFLWLVDERFVSNQTKCLLGKKSMSKTQLFPTDDDLKAFTDFFEEDYAKKCQIQTFTRKNRKRISAIVTNDDPRHKPEELKKILASPGSCSCYRCGLVGDAIIVLEVPEDYTILTFDRGLSEIARLLGKPCETLPSAISIMKQSTGSEPRSTVSEPSVSWDKTPS
jgi:hypothetical protein